MPGLLELSQMAGQRTGLANRAEEDRVREWDRSLLELKRGWQEQDTQSAFENDLKQMAEETRMKREMQERDAVLREQASQSDFGRTQELTGNNFQNTLALARLREGGASDRQQAGFDNAYDTNQFNAQSAQNRETQSQDASMQRLMEQLSYNRGQDQTTDARYDAERASREAMSDASNQARVDQEAISQIGQTTRDFGGGIKDLTEQVGGWLGDLLEPQDPPKPVSAGDIDKEIKTWYSYGGENRENLRDRLVLAGVSEERATNIARDIDLKTVDDRNEE